MYKMDTSATIPLITSGSSIQNHTFDDGTLWNRLFYYIQFKCPLDIWMHCMQGYMLLLDDTQKSHLTKRLCTQVVFIYMCAMDFSDSKMYYRPTRRRLRDGIACREC